VELGFGHRLYPSILEENVMDSVGIIAASLTTGVGGVGHDRMMAAMERTDRHQSPQARCQPAPRTERQKRTPDMTLAPRKGIKLAEQASARTVDALDSLAGRQILRPSGRGAGGSAESVTLSTAGSQHRGVPLARFE
jgi:hypothetical protein